MTRSQPPSRPPSPRLSPPILGVGDQTNHTLPQPPLSLPLVGVFGLIPHPPRQPKPRAKGRRPDRYPAERVDECHGRTSGGAATLVELVDATHRTNPRHA